MNNLAPVVLFVYNRPEHTKRTVESLNKNTLASKSTLFIFSDGAKGEKDVQNVTEVRNLIKTIEGFDKIEIRDREKNFGLANSVITGVTEIIHLFGKVIVLEDDIITSPSFLSFMNKALIYYEMDSRIYSISGYSYPIKIPVNYNSDIWISYRPSSWGWGTWKNRWQKTDWEISDYEKFKEDSIAQKNFNRGGEDFTPMLHAQLRNEINSWAIRWAFAHFKNCAYSLTPVKSLCKNIGTDKSGTHSTKTNKFEVDLMDNGDTIPLSKEININDEMMKNLQKFVRPSIVRKVISKLKY